MTELPSGSIQRSVTLTGEESHVLDLIQQNNRWQSGSWTIRQLIIESPMFVRMQKQAARAERQMAGK